MRKNCLDYLFIFGSCVNLYFLDSVLVLREHFDVFGLANNEAEVPSDGNHNAALVVVVVDGHLELVQVLSLEHVQVLSEVLVGYREVPIPREQQLGAVHVVI